MRRITEEMFKLWNMVDEDWMGYLPSKSKGYEFHHITKREDRGKLEISNGAVLVPNAHQYLHTIEYKDNDMYKYINFILKIINTQGYMPSKEQLKAIDEVLKRFEREHCGDRNKKGNLIIKEEYTKRLIKKR